MFMFVSLFLGAQINTILLPVDEMTSCNVKEAARSDEPTEN